MTYVLFLTNIVTLFFLYLMTKRSLKLVEKLDEIGLQVEESLDIIDESYKNVSRHLKSPVLFDDPVVTTMIKDVKNSREAMLLIANKVMTPFETSEEKEEDRTIS